MMDSLRRSASSWLARGLFGLLAISFGVWGASRGSGTFQGSDTVVRVGGTDVSAVDFQRAFDQQLNIIRRQYGQRITAEQARAAGVDSQVLSNLVSTAAFDNQAKALGLALPDSAIEESVRKDPSFQGPDGKFDKAQYAGFLASNGFSEARFFKLRERDETRGMLTRALIADATPAPMVADLVHTYLNETRVLQILNIDAEKAITVPEPDEAKLKALYEVSKPDYTTPEQRKVGVLMLSLEEAKKRSPLSDADVQSAYESEKARYEIPEKRRFEQLSFKDKASAEAMRVKIVEGRTFADAGKELGAKESDIALGVLTQKDFIDPTIAAEAFKLEKDVVSPVIEGRFTTVLLKATEITPGRVRPFDEVKAELTDRLSLERAGPIIQKLHDDVDDARASGKTLKLAAEALKIPYLEIASLDALGNGPDGKPAFAGKEAATIAKAAFDAKQGIESDAVELSDGGYAYIDVAGITPGKQKTFDEVKSEVRLAFVTGERRKLLGDLAQKLAERAAKGEALEAIAGDAQGQMQALRPLKRTDKDQALSDNALLQAFNLGQGGASSAPSADGKSRTIVKVVEIIAPPAITAVERTQLVEQLTSAARQEIMAGYLGALQDKQGVNIDQAMYRRITGADTAPQ